MRVWITDRWWGVDPSTNKKTRKKANHGVGSRWQVSHYTETQEGTKRLVSKNFERQADAEAYRTKTEHELREGIYRPVSLQKKSFGEAAAAWLESKKKPTGSSLRRYRNSLDIWVLPRWGARTISSITRAEIDEWITALMNGTAPSAEGRHVGQDGLSPAGLKAVWMPFNAALLHATSLGWITASPSRGVELPRSVDSDKVFLNYLEVERLSNAAREVTGRQADSLFIDLMSFAGLRPGEVVGLQAHHVDLSSRRIRIRRTATVDVNGAAIFGPPKHGERREVPIVPHLLEPLNELLQSKSSSDPLIDSTRGQTINLQNWQSRLWNHAVAGADLSGRGLTPKALRHTAASMAIAAGADVKVVQRMLGHADATMTLNTYADLWPDRLDEVTEAMSRERQRALDSNASA
jgi:integrase